MATSRPSARPGTAKRFPLWALAVAGLGVVLLAAVVAIAVTRGGDEVASTGGLHQVAPVRVQGQPLAPYEEGSSDPAVGAVAPTLAGQGFDGAPRTIGGGGSATLVVFVAHWCPHCQREVPALAPELGRITPAGAEVVTVSTGVREDAPNYPPSAWLEREGWPAPVLVDDEGGAAAEAYGLSGYPYFVALDASGKVVRRASGELGADEVQRLLQAATAGR